MTSKFDFYAITIITGRNEVVAKVMFLHVCVILFTGGVSGQGEPPWSRHHPPPSPRQGEPPRSRHPPGRETPQEQTRPCSPPGPEPPRSRHPHSRAGRTPPGTHPPREAHSTIRSTSGRYASYWNAFLFNVYSLTITAFYLCTVHDHFNRVTITPNLNFGFHGPWVLIPRYFSVNSRATPAQRLR